MKEIQILDQLTIDKIAAGEVIERPASVVKELVENAIDAGSSSIVVEIQEGGISLIRITDNGCGMNKSDISTAFLRHATSKIRSVDDLEQLHSLGFRGEALSSIAAVSQVELITKTISNTYGYKYVIEGGTEKSLEEIGAPQGTTFLVHQLFYNTPARRKFLKTSMTEASHVGELVSRLALSHPEISFQFINKGEKKLHTSGNGNLKEVIYQIYGRDVANNLLEIDSVTKQIHLTGYLGNPGISRGNRNFETYFINKRYVKNSMVSKAIEDAYKDFSMQHRYPFVVLELELDGEQLDINVHPTKMEVRFHQSQAVYQAVYESIQQCLQAKETIPEVVDSNAPKDIDYFMKKMQERVTSYHQQFALAEVKDKTNIHQPEVQVDRIKEAVAYRKTEQLNLFEEQLLTPAKKITYQIIGQVFDTYWIVQFKDNLYIIDQHAAHERVLYEQTLKQMQTRQYTSQYLSPPIILSLTMPEIEILDTYQDQFARIGFEIEAFGGKEYAVRAVPDNLFKIAKNELLIEMLDSLSMEMTSSLSSTLIDEKIASMSCKAAVKGNSKLSIQEVDALIGELLTLDNPYHCPHGRPTIIAMTQKELEKRFKRIVS
ncbi:MAG: DNA mismatch repair endonuclease MutL [Lachnospiraceae bacterium]